MRITNVDRLLDALGKRISGAKGVSVIVGYMASYALHVHEDLEVVHQNGQAKFLEQPARERRGDMAEEAKRTLKEGGTMEEALLASGHLLEDASQPLVPVATGYLKASSFTEVET